MNHTTVVISIKVITALLLLTLSCSLNSLERCVLKRCFTFEAADLLTWEAAASAAADSCRAKQFKFKIKTKTDSKMNENDSNESTFILSFLV